MPLLVLVPLLVLYWYWYWLVQVQVQVQVRCRWCCTYDVVLSVVGLASASATASASVSQLSWLCRSAPCSMHYHFIYLPASATSIAILLAISRFFWEMASKVGNLLHHHGRHESLFSARQSSLLSSTAMLDRWSQDEVGSIPGT
jgi:hypothetical protein